MNLEIVKIKKINPKAIIPTQADPLSAGYDLFACIDTPITIRSGETVKIGTGLAIQPPQGYFGAIFARSGLATKHGLRPANAVGVCDEGYQGEYIVALHNDGTEPYTIQPNDRIAQLVFLPYLNVDFIVTDTFSETERGDGGFGSSGR